MKYLDTLVLFRRLERLLVALVIEALLYRWRISGEGTPLRIGDLDPGAVGSAGQPVPIVYGRDATALRRFLGQTEVD